MIKRLLLKEFESVDNIILEEVNLDKPLKGEVKIKVKASALNRDQLPYISGFSHCENRDGANESLLGYESAGIVIEVGENVDKSWIGKEVAPIGAFDVKKYGTIGEEAIVPADRLIEKPKNISYIDATAIWVPFITAYGIISKGKLKKGETVLISAANSVVGLAAYDIAKSIGATPILTVRSERAAEDLIKLGYKDITISSADNFKDEIMKLTNNQGVGLVFDPIGGEFLSFISTFSKIDGRIVEYGILGGIDTKFPVVDVISKGLTISGYTMGEILRDKEKLKEVTKFILENFENGNFNARVSKVFKLEDYKKAFNELQNGKEIGRIVLDIQ